jgi:hypothetical protein
MLEAYCWPQSVEPGEPVGLHVSTDLGSFDVTSSLERASTEPEWSGRGSAAINEIPTTASADGCRWPAALQIPTSRDAPSGYRSVAVTAGDERADAFFVIRPRPGSPSSPILLVLATPTWNAYNDWGGPSLYTGGTRVSFERPMARGFLHKPEPARRKMQPTPDREALWFFEWATPLGLSNWSGGAGWWNWERPFNSWAWANGFGPDVITGPDLESHPVSVEGYRLLLSVGHDEYWSWGMRDTFDAFTATGGNAAIFSGNTCFWQVRSEGSSMVGYKYRADEDPVLETEHQHLLTSAWVDRRVGRTEFSSIGLSFSRGGYARYGLGTPRSSGGYSVWRPDHWAFEGTGLSYGDSLGIADTICAYEVDGCELQLTNGLPEPTHADGAPASLHVLATAPAHLWSKDEQPSRYAHEPGDLEEVVKVIHGDGWEQHVDEYRYNHAVIGCFETDGGGTVFNAGCTDWTYGLGDGDVARVTTNVLTRLSS